MGGATPLEGRVEVFHLGHWGTVCDYNWNFIDAIVVCRQLGYPRAVEAPRYATFGAGSGPSWYSDVYCVGTEWSLTQCYHSTSNFGSACSHSYDAGVVCASESRSTPCICHFRMIVKWASCVWTICVSCCSVHSVRHICLYMESDSAAMVMGIYLIILIPQTCHVFSNVQLRQSTSDCKSQRRATLM